jgi:hypothetical protein
MHGKTVLITGGTGGIDRAAAIGLLLALMHPIAWKGSSAKFVSNILYSSNPTGRDPPLVSGPTYTR